MVDKDGLALYRSLRGTSNLESLHQYLTTSFGHTKAGPWYSDLLLTVLRHFYNWRVSQKNRPNFPNLNHYDGLLIDCINNLYEQIYGFRKHRGWVSFNEILPLQSTYGIVPVDTVLTASLNVNDKDIDTVAKNATLKYLSVRQNLIVPFLPIRGENEEDKFMQSLTNF